MWIIVTKYLIPSGYGAMAVFPFVLVTKESDKENHVLIQHEKIHLRQQLELLVVPFFIWYFVEYMLKFIQFGNHSKAYHAISFEKEAYSNEAKMNYLEKRKWWSFLKYI